MSKLIRDGCRSNAHATTTSPVPNGSTSKVRTTGDSSGPSGHSETVAKLAPAGRSAANDHAPVTSSGTTLVEDEPSQV